MTALKIIKTFKEILQKEFLELIPQLDQKEFVLDQKGDYSIEAVKATWNLYTRLELILTQGAWRYFSLSPKAIINGDQQFIFTQLEFLNQQSWVVDVRDNTSLKLAGLTKYFSEKLLDEQDIFNDYAKTISAVSKFYPEAGNIRDNTKKILSDMKSELVSRIETYQKILAEEYQQEAKAYQERIVRYQAKIEVVPDDAVVKLVSVISKISSLAKQAIERSDATQAQIHRKEAQELLDKYRAKQSEINQLLQEIEIKLEKVPMEQVYLLKPNSGGKLEQYLPKEMLLKQKACFFNMLETVNQQVEFCLDAFQKCSEEINKLLESKIAAPVNAVNSRIADIPALTPAPTLNSAAPIVVCSSERLVPDSTAAESKPVENLKTLCVRYKNILRLEIVKDVKELQPYKLGYIKKDGGVDFENVIKIYMEPLNYKPWPFNEKKKSWPIFNRLEANGKAYQAIEELEQQLKSSAEQNETEISDATKLERFKNRIIAAEKEKYFSPENSNKGFEFIQTAKRAIGLPVNFQSQFSSIPKPVPLPVRVQNVPIVTEQNKPPIGWWSHIKRHLVSIVGAVFVGVGVAGMASGFFCYTRCIFNSNRR